MDIIIQSMCAFFATITFSIMFNTPKRELIFCGIAGGVGWLVYSIALKFGLSNMLSNFFGTLFIAYLSRFFAVIRKNPMSVFLISGIITLVPGAGIYNTVLNIIMNNNKNAAFYGLETVKVACAIAFGIIVILALPSFLFDFNLKHRKKDNTI